MRLRRKPRVDHRAPINALVEAVQIKDQEALDAAIDEIDRNARAYGWEAGKHGELKMIVDSSPDNPFLDPEWRKNVHD